MANFIWWSVKEINWKYWKFLSVSVKVTDLKENSKWYASFTISPRKEVWKYWETHNMMQNDYDPREHKQDYKKEDKAREEAILDDETPF